MAEKPEDLNLPNSIITRIIKEALPDGVIVAKDARSAMAKAASVFVLYVASTANNNALKNKRKTISTQDVFEAITEMDLDQFLEPLKSNLEAYKEEQKRKKEEKRKSKGEEANKINEDSELVDDSEVATETIDDD